MRDLKYIDLVSGYAVRVPWHSIRQDTLDWIGDIMRVVDRGGYGPLYCGYEIQRIEEDDDGRHTRQWVIRKPGQSTAMTLALAMKSRPGAALWRYLKDDEAQPPAAPWLLSIRDIEQTMDAEDVKCLQEAAQRAAWAWIFEIWRAQGA